MSYFSFIARVKCMNNCIIFTNLIYLYSFLSTILCILVFLFTKHFLKADMNPEICDVFTLKSCIGTVGLVLHREDNVVASLHLYNIWKATNQLQCTSYSRIQGPKSYLLSNVVKTLLFACRPSYLMKYVHCEP